MSEPRRPGGPDDPTDRIPGDEQWRRVDPQSYPQPSHPPTRAFEPVDPTGVYPATAYTQQNAYPDAPQAEPKNNGNRTLWLVGAVALLLIAVIGVSAVFLINNSDNGGGSNNDAPVAGPAGSQTNTTTTQTTTTEPTTTSAPPSSDSPTATAGPGQVLYSLTGDGKVLGVTYTVGSQSKFSASLITPPWSVAVTVDAAPSLGALVISGKVTCTITKDGSVIATSTATGGLLNCSGG
ncbi:hypothetical protein [Williamsia sp. CHRR-6]|uniref:hypothetical protein n=1 Tax=Williamsia sp. CHRR-6 TaxID=2835871 RepID=UPI001BD9B613|nr:hypothetical protein [Williamsia sp. CHRR-6]MBT0567482.1 hypothetical protein [Williamsia sp. CHRR-6]